EGRRLQDSPARLVHPADEDRVRILLNAGEGRPASGKTPISASAPWTDISLRERMPECTNPIRMNSMRCLFASM
ncbi:MAG: hypothetical protein PHR49_07565, partial [Methanoculleus sp.]|nr:hypothetical protein [Methanoculleus sp.]